MTLSLAEIKNILPHREPMLMIDSVSDLTPGESVVAEKYIDPNWDIFRGHFPENPITPGVYLAEAMAQAADLILLTIPGNEGKTPLFLSMSRMRFMRPVLPGSTVELIADLKTDLGDGVYECICSAYDEGSKVASGQVTIALR